VFASVAKDSGLSYSQLMPNAWYYVISAVLLIAGAIASLSLVFYAKRHGANKE